MAERCNHKQKPTASNFRASQANLSEEWWSTEDMQPLSKYTVFHSLAVKQFFGAE